MLTDGVIELIELNPAQTQALAAGTSPLEAVSDYPHHDRETIARMFRDPLMIDNWVPGFGLHLIRRLSDGLVVGDVGFHAPPDERGVVEISYGLAESARGNGLASRAVRLLSASAMTRGGVACIIADTSTANEASAHVLQAAGYQLVRQDGARLRYRLRGAPTPQPASASKPTRPSRDLVVIVTFAPTTHAELVREALAVGGAGRLGSYSACSFSATGQGRFRPDASADPLIGSPNELEVVEEVRIESVCERSSAKAAIEAMLSVHPYEVPAYHCYQVLTLADL